MGRLIRLCFTFDCRSIATFRASWESLTTPGEIISGFYCAGCAEKLSRGGDVEAIA
jgi:hypothetical protein